MRWLIFIFCPLWHFAAAADVSQCRHNRMIVWQPMYSLPTQSIIVPINWQPMGNWKTTTDSHTALQWKWPLWEETKPAFQTGHWSGVFSVVVWVYARACIRVWGLALGFMCNESAECGVNEAHQGFDGARHHLHWLTHVHWHWRTLLEVTEQSL